jgi:PAS domain S-box-containing protein
MDTRTRHRPSAVLRSPDGRADISRVRRFAWLAYLGLGAVMLAAYLFIHAIRVGPLFNLIGLSGAVAIVVAVRIHRPKQRLAWYLVAIGQVLFVAGDVITYNYKDFFGTEAPFPSIGDLLYLLVYPFLILGILLLIRRREPGGDRVSLLDSLIVGVGVGALSWVLLIAPNVRDETLSLAQKLVAMAYPVMDLVLLTVAVRLTVGTGGKRPSAFYLLTASVIVLFVTDSIYGWIVLHGTYDNGTGYLEGGWGLFYLLWGAAALHPAMKELDEPHREMLELDPQQSRRRLYLVAAASLMSPTLQLIQALRDASLHGDVAVVATCTIALFVMVMIRLNWVMVDINEHKRTERQLRETENKYRTLVEGLPAVVYIAEFGEDGAWTYISPQIESVLGFSQNEWMTGARLWRDRILPEDRQIALDAEQQLLAGDRHMQCEYRILGRDDAVIWIREEAEPLLADSGHPRFMQGVMYDITEQKQAEARLMTALETEKEASSRLRSLHEMQNSFLQAVSHDLRTPLTTILAGSLTLARDDGAIPPAEAKDMLGRMAANAQKLHRLLTNLLDLDRMSRGVVEPNRHMVDLTSLMVGVLDELEDDSHPISVTTTTPVFADVDAAHCERIVENLVTNAIRYTPPGTQIWCSAEDVGDGALITVEDAGPGVPAELREAIFEPFRQGSETIKHSPGVGVGLSLVARFAELHRGRAWVEERVGGGASFKVHLPHFAATMEPPDPEEPEPDRARALAGASALDGHGDEGDEHDEFSAASA